jgi:NAD(P)H-dependent flavin oxidoreductase YrpB (nitropropane dioxygenase family)
MPNILNLLGVELPIIQAPMAGASTPEMAIAVAEAGGLGSLPTAMYNETELRAAFDKVRAGTRRPINLNFFTHTPPAEDPARQAAWLARLTEYYVELGLDPNMPKAPAGRAPFSATGAELCPGNRPRRISLAAARSTRSTRSTAGDPDPRGGGRASAAALVSRMGFPRRTSMVKVCARPFGESFGNGQVSVRI